MSCISNFIKIDFSRYILVRQLYVYIFYYAYLHFDNSLMQFFTKPPKFLKYPESNFFCASSKSRPVEVEHGQKTSKQCNDVNLMSSCFFWVRFKFILYPDPWESTIAFLF